MKMATPTGPIAKNRKNLNSFLMLETINIKSHHTQGIDNWNKWN